MLVTGEDDRFVLEKTYWTTMGQAFKIGLYVINIAKYTSKSKNPDIDKLDHMVHTEHCEIVNSVNWKTDEKEVLIFHLSRVDIHSQIQFVFVLLNCSSFI